MKVAHRFADSIIFLKIQIGRLLPDEWALGYGEPITGAFRAEVVCLIWVR